MARFALRGEALTTFIELCSRGYTVRRLRELMIERGFEEDIAGVPDVVLVNLYRELAPQWGAERDALDAATRRQFGLTRKLERVRRLCETAERIEAFAAMDTRWSGEYRRYLSQLQAELEPLGIEVNPGDAWVELLGKIAEAGRRVDGSEPMDEGDLDSTEADSTEID